MKQVYFILSLLCIGLAAAGQEPHGQADRTAADSADVFFWHLKLNEVTVSSPTGDIKHKHSSMPVAVLTAKEVRQSLGAGIISTVAHQPGIAQVTTGSSIAKPLIRGLGYNRVVVISEGVRQEGQQWGDEHGVEVDGNSVYTVEIVKGPASLMYGGDAMAGVLILHAPPAPTEGSVEGNLASEYQTNNGLVGWSGHLAGNNKGFVWSGTYSGRVAHAYHNRADGYVPGTQFAEQAARLMLGANQPWGHSHLTATYFHQTPSIAEGERDSTTGRLISGADNLMSYQRTLPFQQVDHYKAVWDNLISLPHGIVKTVVGFQQNRRQEFEDDADECEMSLRLNTTSYDVRYQLQEWRGWRLSTGVGGMWQQSRNLSEETLIPAYHLFDIGGYATVSKSVTDREGNTPWTLNGGLRLDHRRLDFYARTFSGLTGSAGAVWNATPHLDLRLNVARGFRAPNISELGSNGIHEGTLRYEIGNPQLKAEYSWQADVGLDYSSRYLSAQVALFANRIENYIFTRRLGITIEDGYRTYIYTQGDARLLGFEAGVDLHPIHSLHFQNTVSLVDARQLHVGSDSRFLPMIPAPRWVAELKYELSHRGHSMFDNAYASLGIEHNFAQNHCYLADDTETPTPAYTLVDIALGSDLVLRQRKVAELYVTVNNLLNCSYQSHLSRLKYADTNAITGHQGVYNMGRNIAFKAIIPF